MAVSTTAGRLTQPAQGVTNSSGVCTITFPPGVQGFVITGGVTVINSPPGIAWTIQINNSPIDATVGTATAGGIQVVGGETLSVTASSLSPGLTVNAVFRGVIDTEENVELIPPSADSIATIAASAAGGPLLPSTSFTIPGGAGAAGGPAILPVAGAQVLIIHGQSIAQSALWSAQWCADAAGAIVIGGSTWGANSTSQGRKLLAPLGPYLQVSATSTAATAASVNLLSVASADPSTVLPPQMAIDVQSSAVGAGATLTTPSSQMIAGKMRLHCLLTQAGTLQIQRWQAHANFVGDAWHTFYQATLTANTSAEFEFTAPQDDWQVLVTNSATTAGTASLTVVGPYR